MLAFFPTSASFLVGTCLGSFFWGILTAVFILFIFITRNKRGKALFAIPAITVVLMYGLSTSFWIISMIRLYEAFITFSPAVDPSTYYLVQGNIHPGYNFAQVWLYTVVTVTGDSVLVWRCHAVWGRRFWYITLIPALSLFATIIGGFGAPIVTLRLISESPEVAASFAPLAASFATTEIATSLVTNLLTTIIIGGRIWWVSTRTGGKNQFSRVIRLVAESGTLLTLLKITEFSLYQVALADVDNIHEMFWTVWTCVPQVVAIVPTLIIILVATGHTTVNGPAIVPSSFPNTMVFSTNLSTSNPLDIIGTSGFDSTSATSHPFDKVQN